MARTKFINFNSIGVKISFSFLLMLIPIFLLGYISQRLSSNALKEQAIQSTTSTIHQTTKNIDDIVVSVNELYKQIIVDPRYQEYLTIDVNKLNEYEKYRLNSNMEDMMQEYAGTNVYVSRIQVVINEQKAQPLFNEEDIVNINTSEWYKEAEKANGKLVWRGSHLELDNALLNRKEIHAFYSMTAIGMSRSFPVNKKRGMVIFDINISSMRKILEGIYLGEGSQIHIISPDQRDIYSDDLGNINIIGTNNLLIQENVIGDIIDNEEVQGYSFITNEGIPYLMVYEKLKGTGYVIIGLLPESQLLVSAKEIKFWTYGLIIITGLFILIVGVMLIPRSISKKIHILIKKMIKVENGNLNITEVINTKDEIGIIDKHFNNMVEKLKSLIQDNYIKQLEKREAELNILQYQINPHFLYNTLESINSIASVYQCLEVCEISERLGEMFRYSINKEVGDFVTLESEINHIKNYIDIYELRFSGKLCACYDVDNNVKSKRILKFILQPIVENAIQHGLSDKEGQGFIEISCFEKNDLLFIVVQDDGKGIEKNRLNEIQRYINDMDAGILKGYERSIGIKNVNMRIKLAYGTQYGIVINSVENGGTQVIYRLPSDGCCIKEELHVQDINCR